MLKFVADVKEWMSCDENNIVAIHCKGGKGRTGTAVSAWLLEDGQFDCAKVSATKFSRLQLSLRCIAGNIFS